MHDARRALLWRVRQKVLLQRMGPRVVELGAGDRRVPGPVPGLELAADVVVLFSQVAQAHRVGVHPVQVGQHVDERIGQGRAQRLGQPAAGVVGGVERVAIDMAHQVEGRAGHRRIGAKAQRTWHRHRGGPECADQRPFARHVVGLGQQLAHRRAADHGKPAFCVLDLVGQVGVAAFEPCPGQRGAQRGHVLVYPGLDGGGVVAHGLVGRAGAGRHRR